MAIIKAPIIPYKLQESGWNPRNARMVSVNPPEIVPTNEAKDI
jgi:hypothetical protein